MCHFIESILRINCHLKIIMRFSWFNLLIFFIYFVKIFIFKILPNFLPDASFSFAKTWIKTKKCWTFRREGEEWGTYLFLPSSNTHTHTKRWQKNNIIILKFLHNLGKRIPWLFQVCPELSRWKKKKIRFIYCCKTFHSEQF